MRAPGTPFISRYILIRCGPASKHPALSPPGIDGTSISRLESLSLSFHNHSPDWCIVSHDHPLNAGLAEIQPSFQNPCCSERPHEYTRVSSPQSPHPYLIGSPAVACLTISDSQQSRVNHQDPLAFPRHPRLGNRHHIYARYQRHEALTPVTRYPWAWRLSYRLGLAFGVVQDDLTLVYPHNVLHLSQPPSTFDILHQRLVPILWPHHLHTGINLLLLHFPKRGVKPPSPLLYPCSTWRFQP